MRAARVLVSTLVASASAAHGGPIITRRHAAALSRLGHQVWLAAPDSPTESGSHGLRFESYPASCAKGTQFAARRPDPVAIGAIRALIARTSPDILYDVHGPAWAIDAAVQEGVPVVSMVGDYNWYCLQTFLVDSRLRRCAGPESAEKCFSCLNRNNAPHRRALHLLAKGAARRGIVRLALWDAVCESRTYAEHLRAAVNLFIVGDRQAHEFLVANGIPGTRIATIPQGLPDDARQSRRRGDEGEPVRNRPLRLGFVGRPHLDKGIHVLGHAFDSIPRDLPLELWIVHSELATLENVRRHFPSASRLEADLASGRVKLMRPTTQEEVFDVMARVDVGIVPSLAYESPSLAMLEFVAQGAPVVRSESRGMDHVIRDGVNGRTFPYGDWRALASVMRELVAEPDAIARWRAALPPIGSDDDYARRLSHFIDSVRAGKPAVEVAMI